MADTLHAQVTRTDIVYLLEDSDSPLSWADFVPWLHGLSEPSSCGVLVMEGDNPMHGAMCELGTGVDFLYRARTILASYVLQPATHY